MSEIETMLSGNSSESTTDATMTDASATTGAAVFKKKGAKRKEFRAPAASLATRSDITPTIPTIITTTTANELVTQTTTPIQPPQPPAVEITDETENESKSTAAAPASSTHDSDDEDAGVGVGSASASALAQAADVDTSDPEESSEDEAEPSTTERPTKRAKKDNPLLQSTRNKLKKDHKLNIESTRSLKPDERTVDKQVTQIIEPSTVKRDPTKPKWSGPAKPSASNVRMISRFDYQPDVCKDYKETGRCGYGDSCKFLHEREDYKQGWELDKDWNKMQEEKRKKALLGITDEDEAKAKKDAASEEGQLPWACLICREGFRNPVVTKCSHYFCEKCAIDNYVKDTKCFACRAQTHGIFNTATKLISVIAQRAKAGRDPKAELERLEKERAEEKLKQQTGEKWQMPGRTAGLAKNEE